MTKTTTEIGVQFDSIADVLTFGIAPAVLVYAWGYGATFAEGSDLQKLGWFISFMFLICGAFRLARFNVQATRPRSLAEGTAKLDKKHFVGLPIPAAAGLIAALVHYAPIPLSRYRGDWPTIYSGLIMTLMAILSMLMVSTIRFTSFKNIGSGKRSTMKVIIIIAAGGMLIWLYSRHVLLILVGVYVTHGIFSRIWSFSRKSKV
jgi:CDP-diacylglycerol--serine O-phosphatidyltransferase